MRVDIQNLHVLAGDGQAVDFRRVRCPVHARTLTLEQCLSCPETGGVARDAAGRVAFASCHHVGAGAEAKRAASGAVIDHAPVSAVMTTDVFAVRGNVSLEVLTDILLERGIGGVPVVDEDGRPVGVISNTDLLHDRFVAIDTGEVRAPRGQFSRERHRVPPRPGMHVEPPPNERVANVMACAAITLPEDAPVARAAAIMVTRGVHRVLVVSDDGRISGIITGSDIMRCVARRAPKIRSEPSSTRAVAARAR